MTENDISQAVIGAAIEVHRHLGPGLLELAYEQCLAREMDIRGINFERQKALPVNYKGVHVASDYRLDFLIAGLVVLELKAVSTLTEVHHAQLLTYLKLGNYKLGLLLNFNVPIMRQGIKRLALNL